jgi:hypothetical protein
MYQMQRVFCATSWELEGERRAFYDVVGEVNETEAMQRGILFVPVTLTNVRDKRPFQFAVEENIRDCSYYLLTLTDGWGPPERNFERDYRFALACRDDPTRPMRQTAFLWRTALDGAVPAGLPAPTAEFSTTEEFTTHARAMLSAWASSASV